MLLERPDGDGERPDRGDGDLEIVEALEAVVLFPLLE
jgi:hypothetical protein